MILRTTAVAAIFYSAAAINAPAPLPAPAPAPAPLVDNHNSCGGWAKTGECSKNPAYMLVTCAKSCNNFDGEVAIPHVEKPATEPVKVQETPEHTKAAFEADVKAPAHAKSDISEQNHQWYLEKQQKAKQQKAKKEKAKKDAEIAQSEKDAEIAQSEKDAEIAQPKKDADIAQPKKDADITQSKQDAETAQSKKDAELAAIRAEQLAKRKAKSPPKKAKSPPKTQTEPVNSDEPYQPITVQRTAKAAPKTTLLSSINAATAVKKAATTLKTTLGNLHLHDKKDQQDAITAEAKKAKNEKLSWHEKALLKQAANEQALKVKQEQKAAAQKKAADDAMYQKEQEERHHKANEIREEERRKQQEIRESQAQAAPQKASSSIGDYLFVAIAVLFLGWFVGMSAMQTDAGKQMVISVSGLIAGARMGSKTLSKVKGGLHRAASGDAYHFA